MSEDNLIRVADLAGTLESYVLSHELGELTEAYYRRTLSVFRTWLDAERFAGTISADVISRFLRDKRKHDESGYYCKSLRNGLMAVLGDFVDRKQVRPVRVDRLENKTFTLGQLGQLIRATKWLAVHKREYYRAIIQVAYYTGLSQCDLHLLTREHVRKDGTVVFCRRKTGAETVTHVPPDVLAALPRAGLLFPRRWSDEQFRKDFKAVCQHAGIVGTFKVLRKTSGTEAESLTGRGHEHLGNTRKVFEKHYRDKNRLPPRKPIKLRPIPA